MPARTLVFGDLHLVRETPHDLRADLVACLRSHPGSRIVLAGDTLDLSADHPGAPRESALRAALDSQVEIVRALAEHVDRGGQLWVTAGNHDAAFASADASHTLARALRLDAEAHTRVRVSPWFVRDGGLHIEHGHLFDPDNAWPHPLASEARSLGVHFVERFIAPTGAHRFLNANDGKPLDLLRAVFAWYGPRAPLVVAKFFDAAFRALAASGARYDGHLIPAEALAREAGFSETHSLDEKVLAALVGGSATPTMASTFETFQRLYLDRVAATAALALGMLALAAGRRQAARALLGAGCLAMGVSWALGVDRYGGSVGQRLSSGARRIADGTGAELVVLGHAHREAIEDRYANTGSFSFPRSDAGRPYVEVVHEHGRVRAMRRHHRSTD
jgi:UDP-2,3-diacylglucosamine pyrophosphatase LpxH